MDEAPTDAGDDAAGGPPPAPASDNPATTMIAAGDPVSIPLSGLTRHNAIARGVDAAAEPPARVPGDPATGSLSSLKSDYSIDGTRQEIAFRLIYILAGVVAAFLFISLIFSLSCWTTGSCTIQDAYNMSAASFTTVFTALVGIVGSVVGFYFGSKSKTGE